MPPWKRAEDAGLIALSILVLALPMLVIVPLALWRGGRPLLHVAERMGEGGRPFRLHKMRTMTVDAADAGVTGADKAARITPFGAWLRRNRGDEIPQLWDVARGRMTFVGPRPPLRAYVERFPEIYAEVLRDRPGITGLATVVTAAHEGRLLARGRTPEETDAIYARVCVPRKARLDAIYRERKSLALDLWIIGRTLRRSSRHGRPARRGAGRGAGRGGP